MSGGAESRIDWLHHPSYRFKPWPLGGSNCYMSYPRKSLAIIQYPRIVKYQKPRMFGLLHFHHEERYGPRWSGFSS